MRIERCKQRCAAACRGWRWTNHEVRIGGLQGRGEEAHQLVTYTCLACGNTRTGKRYPILLAGFFPVPANK